MRFTNRQWHVWQKWSALISVFIQEYRLPESVHFGKVCWPIILYYLIEYWPNQIVLLDFPIKGVHQQFNLLQTGNSFSRFWKFFFYWHMLILHEGKRMNILQTYKILRRISLS